MESFNEKHNRLVTKAIPENSAILVNRIDGKNGQTCQLPRRLSYNPNSWEGGSEKKKTEMRKQRIMDPVSIREEKREERKKLHHLVLSAPWSMKPSGLITGR